MNPKPLDIFTSIDLEMNQNSRKIIQIGAVVGNISNGKVIDKISIYVNPNEKLASHIEELTGIRQKDVDNGLTLEEAYYKLKKWHENYQSFINCITWGGEDTKELLLQLKQENPNFEDWCFGRRCIDVKTIWVSYRLANGLPIQGGLAKSMTKVGLAFKGRKHNAADDAENAFQMYLKMLCLLKNSTK